MIETILTGKTPDIGEENIKKLMTMFPEVVTEGKVDFEKLRQVLGEYVDDSNERYNFTWNGKGRALRLSQTPSLGTLRPCKEESKDWDTTQNLYIEGDNLEVLKLLQKSYYGKIKMIYIDPPYNTGKDFVYKDDFHDSIENYKRITGQIDGNGKAISTNTETSGRYHTDWLNMMYPRLRLARNLLKDDGIIFISIDDNEVHNLRKICDEVFGEDNFISILSVENNPKGRKNSAFVSVSSEYCVIYTKNKNNAYFIENVPKRASDMVQDEEGNFVHSSGKRVLVGENSFNKYVTKVDSDKNYSVYYRAKDKQLVIKREEYGTVDQQLIAEGYVKYYSHYNGRLVENTYTESKFRELFEKRALEFSQDKIYEKNYSDTVRIKSQLVNREYEAIVRGKKMKYSMELTTTGAGTYLKNLFKLAESPFPAPKNVGYLKLLISLFESEPFIVLDFFSGSATTADAVMQLNAEDGGNRRFIMVQLPELTDEKSEVYKAGYKNICEIGKERIRRAGEKIKEEYKDKENIENLDIGFKVFKLDTSNIRKWQPDYDNLEQSLLDYIDNFVEGRTEFDVVYEIMLKYGLDLTYPVDEFTIAGKKVYSIGYGMLMICLDNEITTEVAKGILTKIKELSPESSRVVFKDNGFKSDSNKTNIKEILKSGGIEEFITI
jgi:adenine-specific DNA-methyltransferase